jgi:phage-related protein
MWNSFLIFRGYTNSVRCDNQLEFNNPPALFPRILRNPLDELYQLRYNSLLDTDQILSVVFFRTASGREPVREFLKNLDKEGRKDIGEDIKLVQFRWPLGMPLVRKIETDLWEVRSHLSGNRITRILFTVGSGEMALLHGFIKKSQKTPANDLQLGRERMNLWQSERGCYE